MPPPMTSNQPLNSRAATAALERRERDIGSV
jgi:hypothetical protein